MTIELRGFSPGHLERLAARAFDRRDLDSLEDAAGRAARYAAHGPAVTGFERETPLFCCGVVRLWPGAGEAWMVTGAGFEARALAIHRLFLKLIASELPKLKLRRLQASVVEDHPVARRWLERLGFAHEGAMRAYGPDGRTHHRYALIREETEPR